MVQANRPTEVLAAQGVVVRGPVAGPGKVAIDLHVRVDPMARDARKASKSK